MRDDVTEVNVGSPAPDFRLESNEGAIVCLSEYRGRTHVVLYFMREFTWLQCQRHAVQLGRMYEQLRARDTEVLILGGGSRTGAERLSRRLKLPCPVLVDPDPERAVYRRYGLDKVWIALQRSGTFLIDKQGIVRYIHQVTNPQASVAEDELMKEVEKLQPPQWYLVEEGDPAMTQEREDFASPASEETIQRVALRMRERNIEVLVVDDGEAARKVVLEGLPEGAEVHSGKSKTLQDAGIFDAIHDASRYDALRPRLFKMDRRTQAREIRKLLAGPDFMLGSVNALTEDGILVVASASSSQLGPYASTAGKVILVVGSQKIVPDLETALKRIRDYVLPWEDAQVRKVMNIGSFVGKLLLIEREWVDGRMTVILVRQPIGI